jgi:hypothetical protein
VSGFVSTPPCAEKRVTQPTAVATHGPTAENRCWQTARGPTLKSYDVASLGRKPFVRCTQLGLQCTRTGVALLPSESQRNQGDVTPAA